METQQNMFGTEGEYRINRISNDTIIKTISYSQTEILSWIISLYCPNGFDLDPTYSKGNFYKVIPEPKYKFDLFPPAGIVPANAGNLPVKSESIETIMFDPPFLAGIEAKAPLGKMRKRFGRYRNIPELWAMYEKAMQEFYRVLKPQGVLVFKCQDTIDAGKQYFSHNKVYEIAERIGFYAKDLFVLLAENRMIGKFHHKQQHARKFHSYFWVFISKNGDK